MSDVYGTGTERANHYYPYHLQNPSGSCPSLCFLETSRLRLRRRLPFCDVFCEDVDWIMFSRRMVLTLHI